MNINSFAQLLDINKPLFSDDPFFNTTFIKENNIKSITGSRSSKKIQDIIRANGLDYYYEFNNQGQLIHQIATFFTQGISKDTNIISYNYDAEKNLTLRRKSDNYGFYSHQFQYDSLNRIIKQTYNREENALSCKKDFELCKRYKISSDSFSYQKLDELQLKKLFYNNYGKAYKQQFYYHNNLGYIIETSTKYLIGNNKSKTIYNYNEKGWLIQQDDYTSLAGNKKTTLIYEYDEVGNVLIVEQLENDQPITKKQFLYDKKTMLITAQIIQDMASGFLQIIQYHYSFF
jgi:hypothetical protein